MDTPDAAEPAAAAPVEAAAPSLESHFVVGVLAVPARRKLPQTDAPEPEPALPEKRRELTRTATDEEDDAFLKKRSLDWREVPQPTEAQMKEATDTPIA